MVFKPGDPKPPGSGRKIGAPNKRNAILKEVISMIAETQAASLPQVIDHIWDKDKKAMIILKLLEMAIPCGDYDLPDKVSPKLLPKPEPAVCPLPQPVDEIKQ